MPCQYFNYTLNNLLIDFGDVNLYQASDTTNLEKGLELLVPLMPSNLKLKLGNLWIDFWLP